jgi:hypothetical protein
MGLVSMSFNPSDDAAGAKAISNPAGCSGNDRAPRWKREDYVHVKHDKLFSDWKVIEKFSLSLSLSLASVV